MVDAPTVADGKLLHDPMAPKDGRTAVQPDDKVRDVVAQLELVLLDRDAKLVPLDRDAKLVEHEPPI